MGGYITNHCSKIVERKEEKQANSQTSKLKRSGVILGGGLDSSSVSFSFLCFFDKRLASNKPDGPAPTTAIFNPLLLLLLLQAGESMPIHKPGIPRRK